MRRDSSHPVEERVMTDDIYVNASQFKDLCAILNYRKRKVRILARESVTLQELNWSGGTINYYHAVDLITNEVSSPDLSRPHPMDNVHEGMTVVIPEGKAVVRTGFFMGKDSTMTIYVHPNNMPKNLTRH